MFVSLSTVSAIVFALPALAQNLDQFKLVLPKGNALARPNGLKLKFLTLGIGTQNYICVAGAKGKPSNFSSIGAAAELRDLSGNVSLAQKLPNDIRKGTKIGSIDFGRFPVIGRHFFSEVSGSKPVPVFVIDPAGKVVTKKVANAPSPQNRARNVDWLQKPVANSSRHLILYGLTF